MFVVVLVYTRLEHYETSSALPLYDDTEVVYRRTSLKHGKLAWMLGNQMA